MQVVMLAGGLGKRIRSVAGATPKPMLEFRGRPFLEYLIRWFRDQGFGRFLVCAGHRPQTVRDHFGDGEALHVEITYSEEPRPVGTGGALALAAPLLEERFIVANADTFLPVDYRELAAALDGWPGLAAIAAYTDPLGVMRPNLAVAPDGLVAAYSKRGEARPEPNRVDAGVVACRREVAGLFPARAEWSFEETIFPRLAETGAMVAWETDRPFYDMGTPEGLAEAERAVDDCFPHTR